MAERENHRLNVAIEKYIEAWEGTSIGTSVRNMYENGTSYEAICDSLDWDYENFCDE